MTDQAERYNHDAKAVLAAVRAWKRSNPQAEPRLPNLDGVTVFASLRPAIPHFDLNDAARRLANYVADEVDNATFMMFYVCWKVVYIDERLLH